MLLRVLGSLAIEADVAVGTGQMARLLGVLALQRGQPVPAAKLAEEVLGRDPGSATTDDLYVVISRLRARLRSTSLPISVERDPIGYRLDLAAADLDASVFQALVDDARRAHDPIRRVDLYRRALALWRGPVLAGLDLGVQPGAVRLEELRESASQELLRCRLITEPILHVLPDAIAEATRHPTSEGLAQLAIEALDAAGRRDEALARYEQIRRHLAVELGISPSAQLEQLHARLLVGHARGESTVPGNLGPAPSGVVGRTEERRGLEGVVGAQRLTTVVGTGGVGKTTLALTAAHAMAPRFPGGVWLWELANLGSGTDDLEGPLASSMGVIRGPDRSLLESIAAVIGRRNTLLLVDNCEHVLSRARETVEALLRLASGLTVLATSREPLGVAGEHLFPLEPLPTDTTAVTLFETRARQVLPSFAVDALNHGAVRSICRRLDGLPLAIELAAARMRAMSPKDLDERLDDLRLLRRSTGIDRHRTLVATIDWSLHGLSAAERRCFDMLSVFAGTFDLGAAETVMSMFDVQAFETDGHLETLVDRSLLVAEHTALGARYRMLEVMRHVGRAHLAEDGRLAAALGAHGSWCCGYVSHLGSTYMSPSSGQVAAQFQADWPNIRLAVDQALRSGDAALAVSLIRPLEYLAVWTMQFEVASWAARAASLPTASAADIAELLGIEAIVRWFEGDHGHAAELARTALEVTADEGGRTFWARYTLASLEMTEGRLETAQRLLVDEIERTVEPIDRAYLLYGLATVCSLGIEADVLDPAGACLSLATSTGAAAMVAAALQAVAVTEMTRVSPAASLDHFRRARDAAEAVGAGIFEVIAAAGILGRMAQSPGALTPDDVHALTASLIKGRNQGNANGCWACIEPSMATAWRRGDVAVARRLREGLRHNIWGARWGRGRAVSAVDAGTTDAERVHAADAVRDLSVFEMVDLITLWLAELVLDPTPNASNRGL